VSCGSGCARSETTLSMKQSRVLTTALLVVSTLLTGVNGSAQQTSGVGALGLTVSPAKLDLAAPIGTNYNVPITISNGSAAATHIQASMVDFTVLQNGNYEFLHIGTRPNSLMRWASINPREFDMPGGTNQQVRLSLTLPKDPALSGEYAGIVFFQTRPVRRAGAVAFSARIATKIYFTIAGTEKIDGAVAKMSVASGSNGEKYRVLFKNTGNVHEYIRGEIQVQKDGATVDRIEIPPNDLVERGGERLIEVTGKSLPSGKYQVVAMVDYGGKAMTGGEVAFNKQ